MDLINPTQKSPQLKLLIVDDDPAIRGLLVQLFTRRGHHVRAYEGAFSALSGIRQDKPDILLSDLNMPRISGFELLAVVRREFPGIKTIAMSGAYSGDGLPSRVQADAFYRKASGLDALTKVVDRVAGRGVVRQPPTSELGKIERRRMVTGIHLV